MKKRIWNHKLASALSLWYLVQFTPPLAQLEMQVFLAKLPEDVQRSARIIKHVHPEPEFGEKNPVAGGVYYWVIYGRGVGKEDRVRIPDRRPYPIPPELSHSRR